MNTPNGRVRPARDSDIPIIEAWLPTDLKSDTLAVNWGLTKRVYKEDGMLVWEDAASLEPVAYFWGSLNTTDSILEVHPARRRDGIGRAFVEYLLEQSRTAGELLLEIEAAPPSSEPFWRAMGFEFPKDEWEPRIGRRMLRHPQALPDGPPVQVKVSFFHESVKYNRESQHRPLAEYSLTGAYDVKGAIVLNEKVAYWSIGGGCDLVVRVEVDGRTVYFDKAKYSQGRALGITEGRNGFSISAVAVRDQ